MRHVKKQLWTIVALAFALQLAHAAEVLKRAALPDAEGAVVGASFSPDGDRLAILRHVVSTGVTVNRYTLQTVDLRNGQELFHRDVLEGEPPEQASASHFLRYSSDGHHLLLATRGSDVLMLFDANKLQSITRIVLHPEVESRKSLSRHGNRYFRGVVSLAVASKAGIFAVLTHDELNENEVFIGSFSSGQIFNSWRLGQGRTSTQLGHSTVSLSADGSRVAVSVLPEGNRLPRDFRNVRLYSTTTGEVVNAMRMNGLTGEIVLLPEDKILAARIDTPGFFSKKACIETWSFNTGKLLGSYCDEGRNVGVALGVSLTPETSALVVGFASTLRKDLEGQVYRVSGRVDVWDESGKLIAYSEEIPRLVSSVQISPDGCWLLVDEMLFHIR
jgi:WD40 repeat protein